MHIDDLLKFALRTINNLHSENYLNDLLCFEKPSRVTRSVNMHLLKEPFYKTKIKRHSLSYRTIRLHILKRQGIIPDDLTSASQQVINTSTFWITIS